MNKTIISILIIITICTFVYSQDVTVVGELNIYEYNNSNNNQVNASIELISPLCWDANIGYPNVHNITNLFQGTTLTTTSATPVYLEFLGCWEPDTANFFRTFGLGLYDVTVRVINEQEQIVKHDHFYIDYRTSGIPEYTHDLQVDFNVSLGNLYYNNTTNLFPENTTIWDQYPQISNIKTQLEPLPPTDLTQTASSGHPVLEWQHASVTPNWRTGYKIYRSLTNPYNYTVIGSVSENTNTFTDEGVLLSGGGHAYYKLTAINGTRESVFSNMIEVDVNYAEKIKGQVEPKSVLEYCLNQNFPNPFNPLTTIAFSLKENSFVTLKVFDILGREVTTLVNDVFEAGNHQVEFDGSNFESGIYFYEISANSFRDVKKLILLK